jgi:pimeloyl-ACP methyl ester carboxylesterase
MKFLFAFFFLFSIIIQGLAQQNAATVPVDQKPFPNSRFMQIDSVRLHYRTWEPQLSAPKGKVLLIHGFIGSTYCFRENVASLVNEGYEVVAVDLPGFGYSERNLQFNQSQSNRARVLWDFVTSFDGSDSTQWNIVGHSMGGGTAEAMALVQPKRIRSLTISDGMVFMRNKNVNGSFVVMTKIKESNKVLVDLTQKKVINFGMIRHLLKNLYGYKPDSAVVEGYLQPLLADGSAECILNVFANSKEVQHLHSDVLAELPVLVIWGKKDRTIRYMSAKPFIKAFPNIELKIIPEAYHSPMETHPQIFNSYLLDFLRKYNGSVR